MDNKMYENYEIIDAHAHIFPAKIAENATVNIGRFYDIPMSGSGTAEMLLKNGRKIGVDKYLVCSTATVPQQTRHINTFIAEECAMERSFYGFGTTHALSEDLEGDIEQIISLGLHGVKLHPDFQQFNADSPEAFRIYEMIEGRLPVLIHCGDNRYTYSAPDRIANVCKNFPNLKIQAAHMGGYQCWESAEDILVGYPNLAIDISSSLPFMTPEIAAERIRKFGVENAFFGCDFPMWKHTEEIERFFALGFSEEENRMILSENFKRFYHIDS